MKYYKNWKSYLRHFQLFAKKWKKKNLDLLKLVEHETFSFFFYHHNGTHIYMGFWRNWFFLISYFFNLNQLIWTFFTIVFCMSFEWNFSHVIFASAFFWICLLNFETVFVSSVSWFSLHIFFLLILCISWGNNNNTLQNTKDIFYYFLRSIFFYKIDFLFLIIFCNDVSFYISKVIESL